jgi:hypothetical protein
MDETHCSISPHHKFCLSPHHVRISSRYFSHHLFVCHFPLFAIVCVASVYFHPNLATAHTHSLKPLQQRGENREARTLVAEFQRLSADAAARGHAPDGYCHFLHALCLRALGQARARARAGLETKRGQTCSTK